MTAASGARAPAQRGAQRGGLRGAWGRAWRGTVWYARELAGETRWDRYLEHCREHGHVPVSRRAFERERSDVLERTPQSRCC